MQESIRPTMSVCVCELMWISMHPVLHRVITYNHPKCLYCTNSITMLSEWLCGTGIAGVVNGPGRSVITRAQGQAQIVMQRDRGPANTLYDQRIIKIYCVM